jgi:hypothetical protein
MRNARRWDQELHDFIRRGDEHVEAFCPKCRVKKTIPWRLLGKVDLSWTLPELRTHMKCSTCGAKPDPDQFKAGRHELRLGIGSDP